MTMLAIAGLMMVQLQTAPTAAELVDAILDHVDYPERLAESAIHLDVEAINQAFGDSVVQDASLRLQDLAVRHREDERVRVGRREEVVRCVEVRGRFDACTIGEGDDLFVSVTEAGPSSAAGEIRAVVSVLWAGGERILRGYYMELFLGRDPESEGVWRVVDTGWAAVS